MVTYLKLNILYLNTQPERKEVVYNAALPLDMHIECVSSLDEAYRSISSGQMDIVLIDYIDNDEYVDLIMKIQSYGGDTLVFLLSSDMNQDAQLRAFNAGATDYIYFPVTCKVLQSRLRNSGRLRSSRLMLRNRALYLQSEIDTAVSIIKERELESLLLLGRASEYKDPDTGSHIIRVGKYSSMIMEKLGGSKEDIELMLYSAPLHDVGKIGIPDNILNKTGKLTDEEYDIMQTHTIKGYEILSGTKSKYLEAGAVIALSHHERFDGTGYPKGLKGKAIPLYGRITAIADVFDALVSERVYKNSWSLDEAAVYIKNACGTHFDPDVANVFLENIKETEAIIKALPPVSRTDSEQKLILCSDEI